MFRWNNLKEPGNTSARATRHAKSQNSVRSSNIVARVPTIRFNKTLKTTTTNTVNKIAARTIKQTQGDSVQTPRVTSQMRLQRCKIPVKMILGLAIPLWTK
mmetsp:Transcript_108055/g.214656  ORF Transcript_108055/g.214656 Transcript_108055/m.214656 type:complete len:101 (+) Transcript_108055:764-1066(+)